MQLIIQGPTSATAFSKYYIGSLDQSSQYESIEKMLPQQFKG